MTTDYSNLNYTKQLNSKNYGSGKPIVISVISGFDISSSKVSKFRRPMWPNGLGPGFHSRFQSGETDFSNLGLV